MKKTRLSLLAVAFGMVASAAQAQDVLRVGTEGNAPKFSMADASGNVTGFDADVANALCNQMHMTCKFVVQDFNTLIPSMDTNRFDVIISGLGITEERKKKIDYSIPYATTPQYFGVPKDSPIADAKDVQTILKGLDGKTVGVVNGTTYAAFVRKNIPGAQLKTYDGTTAEMADFSSGRLDAVFTDSPTWKDFFSTPESDGFIKVDVKFGPSTNSETLGQGMGVGLAKGNTELKAKLDKAVCAIIKDGEVTRSSEKWFGDDYALPCKQ